MMGYGFVNKRNINLTERTYQSLKVVRTKELVE